MTREAENFPAPGSFDPAAWLGRYQELGGMWGWTSPGERVSFCWPANGNELLIREHWRAIEHDEARREEVRRLVRERHGAVTV